MTLDECLRLAEQGNTDAMVALAKYYSQETEQQDLDAAEKYYEMAADAGNFDALLHEVQISELTCNTFTVPMLTSSVFDAQTAEESIGEFYKWASKLHDVVSTIEFSESGKTAVDELYFEAVIYQASIDLLKTDHESAAAVTANINYPYIRVLHGLALYKLANLNSEIEKAIAYLTSVEDESVWNTFFEKANPKLFEMWRNVAGCYLAVIYRMIQQDLPSSYRVWTFLKEHTKDEGTRNDAQNELSHFRKTLFGSYRYVE
ncbi:MAG: hypothetical protein MJ074_03250 [Oscillospiraceae bacterium]|nr:hypothetical protein [Oscillospiraceae bacterium]